MFRRLQSMCIRNEARKVATAFALFTPASLAAANLGLEITGGYAAMLGNLFPMRFAIIIFVR
jgi:hypothetical protein